MYSYTAATLAIRAKCSLSFYYLSLPNDQPFCCRRPCCHFSVSPRILSGYLLGFSSPIPSKSLFPTGRRRLRVFCRSRGSDITGLLAEPEERFQIESIEGERRTPRKEGKAGICFSSSVRDSELDEVGYGNRKKGARYDAGDLAEEEVREVRKYVDDSRNDESAKRNGGFRRLGVKDVEEKVDRRDKVNVWESGADRRSKKVQLDDVKRASVSANAKEIEKGGSSASAARQNSGMDHRVAGHDRQRRRLEKQSIVADFRCNDVRSAAYPQRDFEETGVRGRGERAYLEQNSAQVSRDGRIHLDGRALEQDESRRSPQRLNEVSLFPGSEFERASRVDDKSVMAGSSIQLRGGERKQIDRGAVEHDEARRKTRTLSDVSEVHSGNMEAFSLYREKRGMEFGSYFVQSSIPATKDKGTQVEMDDACYDQIEISKFNSNNIVNATSSWGPPVSRVDPQEYGALLASNQVSSMREQNDQANSQAYLLYGTRVESERDTSQFDLKRSNNRRISNSQEIYNSRIENEKEFSSTESSSLVLTREEEIRRSSLTGKSSQSASMEMTSTGSLHGEFVGKLQKEVVALNESGKTPNVSAGIQIGKPGRRDVQATLRVDNRNETSSAETYSTVLTQERKERHSSLLVGESSQRKTMQVASTGSLGDVSSSVKTYSEVDNHSGMDDIHHVTNDAIESSKRLDKSSAFHVDEFVHEIQHEIMSLNESGKEPNVSTIFQIEETGKRESQATAGMQLGELTGSRGYGDGRHIKEGGRLSASGSGMRGPSDEMWGVQVLSSQETSNAEEPEENSPTSGSMEDITTPTPTLETAITRRSPKSLWSYVADIIRMSWISQGHSPSSTLKSNKRASSNESLSSEAWFSGPEPDEDGAGDETQNTKKTGLLKDSGLLKESVKLPFEESKRGDRLTGIEPNSSISSGFMTSGLSARTASSSVEVEDSKSSQGTLSSVATVEQQLASKSDVALPSTTDIVESRVRDKVKVLKPSSSYPVGVMRVGFTSIITQATGAEQMEAAQVGEGNNSSLEMFEQPSESTVDSALPRITDIEEVDRPGSIPKLELDPFREKLPEVGGTEEAGIKRRKFQRNKQVLSEQFDEWEEAFKRENEQKQLDEFFMREAILEAKKGADTWEVPVGAVLVQNGKIIARGCNMVEELRDSTAHAEMICIREASNLLRTWRLAETTLYVTLEPCPMCAGAILQARIDTVVWGAPNRLLGADGSWVRLFPGGDGGSSSMNPPSQMVGPVHPFHPKITIRRGVLETECGDVMQQFFKLRRKKDKKPESSPPPSCLPISNRPTKFFSKLHNIFGMMFCL